MLSGGGVLGLLLSRTVHQTGSCPGNGGCGLSVMIQWSGSLSTVETAKMFGEDFDSTLGSVRMRETSRRLATTTHLLDNLGSFGEVLFQRGAEIAKGLLS